MTTRARSRSWPSAGVRLRGRADDRWTRCSELLVSSRKRSTRQPELSQAGPSDSQRGGRARAHSRQLPVALGLSVQPSGADQLHVTFGRCLFPNPIFIRTDGHKSRYGRRGVTCAAVLLVRLAPPVTVSPRYAGGLKHRRRRARATADTQIFLFSCGGGSVYNAATATAWPHGVS